MGFSPMLLALLTVFNCIFYLNARYVGVPQTTANLKAVLKRELDLKCIYEGDDNGEFEEWYKDGVPISKEMPGHYIVKHSEKESVLKIKIFVTADAEVRQWYVKTRKSGNEEPTACRFDKIALQPSPQGIATERANEELDSLHGSIRRSEDQSIRFKCVIEPEAEAGHSGVKWQFSADGSAYGDTPADVVLEDDQLVIQRVKKFHRGYYQCGLNNVTFTALLRVKDRLAALWPFLGIVGVVVVLVGVILIFEKRHASSKRAAAADDDDQDQANDPLVRTTTKSSDNDSKKRAVKA